MYNTISKSPPYNTAKVQQHALTGNLIRFNIYNLFIIIKQHVCSANTQIFVKDENGSLFRKTVAMSIKKDFDQIKTTICAIQ